MFKTILVPQDGSDLAARILPHVEQLVKLSGSRVVLLEVVPSAAAFASMAATPNAAVVDFTATADRIRGEAETHLRGVAQDLAKRGLRVEHMVREGDAGETITHTASEVDADLIAMTTHGRGGLERAVFGSVADSVVRTTSHPVYLLPIRDERAER